MFFSEIDCEPEDCLATAETCRSNKQNRMYFCLNRYETLCIDLLNNIKRYHTLKFLMLFEL